MPGNPKSKIPVAHKGERQGQEGEDQVFEDGDQIADQNEQTALPDPLGQLWVLLGKGQPKLFACFHRRPPFTVDFYGYSIA